MHIFRNFPVTSARSSCVPVRACGLLGDIPHDVELKRRSLTKVGDNESDQVLVCTVSVS